MGAPQTKGATSTASGGGGIFDPKIQSVDPTNPLAAGLLKMLSTILQQRMSMGPQQQNNLGGPMAQLYRSMPTFNPGGVVPGNQPVPSIPGVPGSGGGTNGGVMTPGGYTNDGLDPTGGPTAKPRTFTPPPGAPGPWAGGYVPADFSPVSSGSRSIRSYQPQYTNQYNTFDPEAFLRSL